MVPRWLCQTRPAVHPPLTRMRPCRAAASRVGGLSGATPACPQPLAPPTPRGLALNPALGLSGHGATDPVPCTPPPEADCFLQRGPGRSWQDACCGPPPCTAWRGGSLACAACRRAPAARPVGLLVQRRRADLVLGRGLKIGEKEERSATRYTEVARSTRRARTGPGRAAGSSLPRRRECTAGDPWHQVHSNRGRG